MYIATSVYVRSCRLLVCCVYVVRYSQTVGDGRVQLAHPVLEPLKRDTKQGDNDEREER